MASASISHLGDYPIVLQAQFCAHRLFNHSRVMNALPLVPSIGHMAALTLHTLPGIRAGQPLLVGVLSQFSCRTRAVLSELMAASTKLTALKLWLHYKAIVGCIPHSFLCVCGRRLWPKALMIAHMASGTDDSLTR